jgi:hypothetical protein
VKRGRGVGGWGEGGGVGVTRHAHSKVIGPDFFLDHFFLSLKKKRARPSSVTWKGTVSLCVCVLYVYMCVYIAHIGLLCLRYCGYTCV